jgi:MoaA/NifB/PqqE/SkfB family radical SAM enzyme
MTTLTVPAELRNITGDEATLHHITSIPVLVLLAHNRCNCRCLMCDIWKIRQIREITSRDIQPHLDSIRALGVRWVVFSGGEPLLHSDLPSLSRIFKNEGIRVTLLTSGLLLEAKADLIAEHLDDIMVSLDGPAEIHDQIRGIPRAFERLTLGILAVRKLRPEMAIRGRCTVQRANHAYLRQTVQAAKEIHLNSISFLAADVTSEAFNRPQGWSPEQRSRVALNASEIEELEREVQAVITLHGEDIRRGLIVEDGEKLGRIVQHFRVHLGQTAPAAPRCNAPWVSAVIEADGALRPCFFHPPLGNVRDKTLTEVLNSDVAIHFRQGLDIGRNPVCQRCVCSLYLPSAAVGLPPDYSC